MTIFNRQSWQKLFIVSSAVFPKLFLMIKDPEIIKFTRDANGPWSTYTVCLVNTVILKLGKEKQLPTAYFPFQLHWFHYWPNWQNQLRPGCELRLIFSPPSRLRSGLPEVVEGWLAPPVLVRRLSSPQLGAPSQGVSHCQNCSNFAQFLFHSMMGGGGGVKML